MGLTAGAALLGVSDPDSGARSYVCRLVRFVGVCDAEVSNLAYCVEWLKKNLKKIFRVLTLAMGAAALVKTIL